MKTLQTTVNELWENKLATTSTVEEAYEAFYTEARNDLGLVPSEGYSYLVCIHEYSVAFATFVNNPAEETF